MAWGANKRGVEDLAARLAADDATLTSLTLLSGRRLGHEEVVQLAEALKSNSALTQLTSCHPLQPPSAAVLAAAIAAHGRLTCLSLGDSRFGDAGLEALGPALRQLTVLDLEHKALTHVAAASLAVVLGDSPPLADLNLSRNSLGCVSQEGSSPCHYPQLIPLSTVCLRCCRDVGATALWLTLAKSRLATLDLSSCGLTALSCTALGAALASAPGLATLRLGGNALGPDGVAAMAAGLPGAPALRSLDLSDTGTGDLGAGAIADALPRCRLASLVLARCGISHAGASSLAAASTQAQLQSLCLAGNSELGDAGAAALACAHVDTLDVSGCGLGSSGASCLVGPTATFATLSLLGNALGDDGVVALATALRDDGAAPRLHTLSVSGTDMGFPGAEALVAALLHGGGPQLTSLEMGGNPASDGSERCVALVATLREGRGDVDVAWKASDPGNEERR